ncbi:glycosyltransferase [Marinomonas sp. C2222]|uniref:Glycosyltransferase n=1 Tax=Marinomonas sargassi TaxID=2984494 RepID=A0ABT2YP24_9GAMM|nr:glycosyltransferase [Marinomonas sargassi]MCV2401638.1 glycosyltransferase [Marinomonas sargassi]
MKIMYVDLQFDYGIETRGKNYIGLDGFKTSMEALGHIVEPFFYDHYLNDLEKLQVDILDFSDDFQPDLIFFCLFKNQFEHQTLLTLKKKFKTINWFGDDQWRFESFSRHYANDFSWCITTDQFSVNSYKAIGQKNVVYSQWAAIDAHINLLNINKSSDKETYIHDVSFVGGYHPYRKWFIDELKKKGIKVTVYGNGWPNGPLSAEGMVDLFKKSKINLNLSNSLSWDLRYMLSNPRSFVSLGKMFLGKGVKNSSQIKARNFEIPFFGGFQLTEYVPSLENYFDIGENIACYSSPDDAFTQIQYYLENNEKRELMKEMGTRTARANHGYINRFKDIFEVVS